MYDIFSFLIRGLGWAGNKLCVKVRRLFGTWTEITVVRVKIREINETYDRGRRLRCHGHKNYGLYRFVLVRKNVLIFVVGKLFATSIVRRCCLPLLIAFRVARTENKKNDQLQTTTNCNIHVVVVV